MSSINNVILSGRLTKEPEIRSTNSGKLVCMFSLAVGRVITQNTPQNAPQADFISCVAWERLAEVLASYTHKGSKINVVGKLQSRSYDDPNIPNRKVFVTEVIVQQLELLDSKPQQTAQQQAYTQQPQQTYAPAQQQAYTQQAPQQQTEYTYFSDEDLPF